MLHSNLSQNLISETFAQTTSKSLVALVSSSLQVDFIWLLLCNIGKLHNKHVIAYMTSNSIIKFWWKKYTNLWDWTSLVLFYLIIALVLCQHRPEHSLGISLKLHKIINQNKAIAYTYMKYDKFWSIFYRTLIWAQSSFFWTVEWFINIYYYCLVVTAYHNENPKRPLIIKETFWQMRTSQLVSYWFCVVYLCSVQDQ